MGIRDFGLFVFTFSSSVGSTRGASALGQDMTLALTDMNPTNRGRAHETPFPPPPLPSAITPRTGAIGGVEDAIARHRFPVKTKGTAGEEDRRGDDDEDVEHRRANDGGHSELVRGAENGLIVDVKSSGADDPAAMNVAPATSSERFNLSQMSSSDGVKKSSQTMAMPGKNCRMAA